MQTLPIAYSPGTYGTYLEWVLHTMMSVDSIKSPFTVIGNSHGFSRIHLKPEQVATLSPDTCEHLTVKFHPKTQTHHSLQYNLESAIQRFNKIILIYPDRDHQLLCINNYLTKVFPDKSLYDGVMTFVKPDDIYNNWPVAKNTPLDSIPVWIKREHMSHCFFDAWWDQVEWYFLDQWDHPQCLVINTQQLLFDLTDTVQRIFDFWQQDPVRDIQELQPWHAQMMSLQRNLDQDTIVTNILETIFGKKNIMSWQPLPIASEAWIQRCLRDSGIELQCHGLDVFPTDIHGLLDICIFK